MIAVFVDGSLSDEDARVSLLQQHVDELTRDIELRRRTIAQLTTRLSTYKQSR